MPVLQDWVNFHFPCKLHIEIDCAPKVGHFIKHIGSRFLLITTQREMHNPNELYILKSSIEKDTEGLIIYDDIENVGTYKELDTAAHFARQSQGNCVIAYGSYESVNIAKVVSILATNDLFAEELVRQTKKPKKKALPLIVIPTMPLMGIECAPFCTILDDREIGRAHV